MPSYENCIVNNDEKSVVTDFFEIDEDSLFHSPLLVNHFISVMFDKLGKVMEEEKKRMSATEAKNGVTKSAFKRRETPNSKNTRRYDIY